MRPLIGLSTYREQARWGVWDQSRRPAAHVVRRVGRACRRRAGAAPAHGAVRRGGAGGGRPPRRAGDRGRRGRRRLGVRRADRTRPPATRAPDRDQWELALLRAADERRLPTLGVCRGMQVMAVDAGGALEQHLPDLVGHERPQPGRGRVRRRRRSGSPRTAGCATVLARRRPRRALPPPPVGAQPPRLRRGRPGPTTAPSRRWNGRGAVLRRRPVAPRGGRRCGALPGAGRGCRSRRWRCSDRPALGRRRDAAPRVVAARGEPAAVVRCAARASLRSLGTRRDPSGTRRWLTRRDEGDGDGAQREPTAWARWICSRRTRAASSTVEAG